MTEYREFIKWLEKRGESLNEFQNDIAFTLYNRPQTTGVTFLIDRLFQYEYEKKHDATTFKGAKIYWDSIL